MACASTSLPLIAALLVCMSSAFARQSTSPPPSPTGAPGASTHRPKLSIGDPAPALAIAKWIKGGPVPRFEPGKVYIVEFWATWCGPCVANIGHLTALQRRYQQQGLCVIGVTKGDEQNTLEGCESMVAMRGRGMEYPVAFDDAGKTYAAYMDASGEEGIPASFVIDRAGKLAFISHPSVLDLVVPSVLAGTWDPLKGPAEVKEAAAELAHIAALARSDAKTALAKWGELERRWPAYAAWNKETQHKALLMAGDAQGAKRCAEEILEHLGLTRDCIKLHIFAWRMAVQPPEGVQPDLDLALKLAKEAVAWSDAKEGEVLRTLAKVHLLRGEKAQAAAAYDKAIEVADERLRGMLTSDREEFFAGR